MRIGLRLFALSCCLAFYAVLTGCRSASPARGAQAGIVQAPAPRSEAAELFAELGGEPAFFELARYLYRWYLDENDLTRADPAERPQFGIRRVQGAADAGDNSRYLEVVLPSIGVGVLLKKADYRIAELGIAVKSDGYRVIRVSRDAPPPASLPGDYAVIGLDLGALSERLFQTRLEKEAVGDALRAHIEASVSRQADELCAARRGQAKTLHFAPVQAIDNEVWVFWEEGRRLFRFASDMDLAQADVRVYEEMEVEVYDILAQTVVSFEERPGDPRFITRDQVGRALYNCVVLGKRTVIAP